MTTKAWLIPVTFAALTACGGGERPQAKAPALDRPHRMGDLHAHAHRPYGRFEP